MISSGNLQNSVDFGLTGQMIVHTWLKISGSSALENSNRSFKEHGLMG